MVTVVQVAVTFLRSYEGMGRANISVNCGDVRFFFFIILILFKQLILVFFRAYCLPDVDGKATIVDGMWKQRASLPVPRYFFFKSRLEEKHFIIPSDNYYIGNAHIAVRT